MSIQNDDPIEPSNFTATSTGSAVAGKGGLLDSNGKWDPTLCPNPTSITYAASSAGNDSYQITTPNAGSFTSLTVGNTVCWKADVLSTNAAKLVVNNITTTIGTATMTIASPCVISYTAHGLVEGDIIRFTTTGALPTGITAGTNYYVISGGLTANAFEISSTRAGSAINTTGSQSGTHTLYRMTNDIVRPDLSALAPGDIAVNTYPEATWNGTYWVLKAITASSPYPKVLTATRAGDTASGTQTIAHGLGRPPRFIQISVKKSFSNGTATPALSSDGFWDGTNHGSNWMASLPASSSGGAGVDSSNAAHLSDNAGDTANQACTVSADSTNISLAWVKTGSPNSANLNIVILAYI